MKRHGSVSVESTLGLDSKKNNFKGLNDVGAMSWNGHHLDVVAQHVLQKRIINDMTPVRVNDKKMSSIQQPIPFHEQSMLDGMLV